MGLFIHNDMEGVPSITRKKPCRLCLALLPIILRGQAESFSPFQSRFDSSSGVDLRPDPVSMVYEIANPNLGMKKEKAFILAWLVVQSTQYQPAPSLPPYWLSRQARSLRGPFSCCFNVGWGLSCCFTCGD